jgi:hypothetical protein
MTRTFPWFLRRWPLAVAALVAALGGLRPAAPSPHAALFAEPAVTSSPAVPAFRLGTAARPFGWATAVADFNHDGLADTAVADRLSRGGAGYFYELRFSVSGLAPRSVSFDSAEPALTVSIRDVDHDNDLDVVVTEALTRTVTNVWLNDGRGHFTEAAPAPEPARLVPLPAMEIGDLAGELAPATTSGERAPIVLEYAGAVPAPARRDLPVTLSRTLRLCDRSYTRPLRAPPASASLLS